MKKSNRLLAEEVNWRIIFKDLIRNSFYIIISAISMMLFAWSIIIVAHKSVYTSTATLAITAKGSGNSTAYSMLITAVEMTDTMREVFVSDVMKKQIEIVVGEYSEDVVTEVSVIKNTNLMNLSITAEDPRIAYEIIQAILENYNSVSDYLFANAIIEIISEPQVPITPSNEDAPLYYTIFAGAAGAVLLIGITLIHSIFRSTVKTKKGAEKRLEGTCLAVVGHEVKNKTLKAKLKKLVKELLITNPTVSFAFEESCYRMANRIEYQMRKSNKKILLVSSVAENEGKTTIAANLALALARKNRRVALIDCDLRRPAMYRLFKESKEPFYELSNFMKGNAATDTIQNNKSGICMIFNKKVFKDVETILQSKKLANVIRACEKNMDYVILDTAPMGYYADTEALAEIADASLLVIRQDYVRVEDINDAIKTLELSGSEFLGYVLNDFEMLRERYRGYYNEYGRYSEKAAGKDCEWL